MRRLAIWLLNMSNVDIALEGQGGAPSTEEIRFSPPLVSPIRPLLFMFEKACDLALEICPTWKLPSKSMGGGVASAEETNFSPSTMSLIQTPFLLSGPRSSLPAPHINQVQKLQWCYSLVCISLHSSVTRRFHISKSDDREMLAVR